MASINPNQRSKTQFLFVCHARFSYSHSDSFEWMKQHYTWQGKARNFCIWDEAIQPAQAVGISYSDLLKLQSHLHTSLLADSMAPDVAQALGALEKQTGKMIQFIDDSTTALVNEDTKFVVVNNESIMTTEQQAKLRQLLNSNKYFGKSNVLQRMRASAVLELLGLSCRVLSSAQKLLPDNGVDPRSCGLTSYFVNVPEDLKNIAILDASFTVNKVIEADTSINKHPVLVKGVGDRIKRYDHVTIHKMRKGSGKEVFQAEWAPDKPVAGTLRAEVAALIASEPDRPTLCTGRVHLPKSNELATFHGALLADLKAEGMTATQLESIRTNTWGTHTSSNDYAECSRVVLASVHNLPQLNTAFDVIATAQDLFYDYTKNSPLKDILLGRKVEAIHQDISRGSLRQVFIDEFGNTQAKPCDIYIADYNDLDGIIEQLKGLMPGVKVVDWKSETVEHKQTQSEIYRTAVTEFLEKLPESIPDFKTKDLKTALKIGKLSNSESTMFRMACQSVIESQPNWSKTGQTWIRFNDALYFSDNDQ